MQDPQTRRDAIRAVLATATLGLVGCARPQSRSVRALPGPAWPRPEREAAPQRQARRFVARPHALVPPRGVRARTSWTASTTITQRANRMGDVRAITVHHDGLEPVELRNESAVRNRLDVIRRGHLRNGWADIGYHFIVDPLGNAWEGRPLRFQGAHVRNNNPQNIGILVLGHFNKQKPTQAAKDTLDELIVELMASHDVALTRVQTHREIVSTACPGESLQRHMDRTRLSTGFVGSRRSRI